MTEAQRCERLAESYLQEANERRQEVLARWETYPHSQYVDLPAVAVEPIKSDYVYPALRELMRAEASGMDVSMLFVKAYMTLGLLCKDVADYRGAANSFGHAEARWPDGSVQLLLAGCYEELGEIGAALSTYHKAEQCPNEWISIEASKALRRMEQEQSQRDAAVSQQPARAEATPTGPAKAGCGLLTAVVLATLAALWQRAG